MRLSFPEGKSCAVWLLAMLIGGCGEPQQASSTPPLRPVKWLTVAPVGSGQQQVFTGQVRSAVHSTLSFKVSGTVAELPVDVGDRVLAGELIASLVPVDYEIGVEQANASVDSADAEFRSARANYDRIRALYENNSVSRGELDQARTRFESAQAQLRAAGKKLESARRQLSYTRLQSPMQCAVAATYVTANENVNPGAPVAEITCGEQFEVEIAVPELLIAGFQQGDSAVVRFDALPGEQFPGKVTEVGVAATNVSTTFPVTVRLLRDDPRLRGGMAAEVTIELDAAGTERLVLPPVAVGEDRLGRYVYVLDSRHSGAVLVRRRAVEVGALTEQGVEILNGLQPQERVVVAGLSKLEDGMAVKLNGAGTN